MTISEQDRYEMHRWFEAQAGREVAATVMAHLPPVGWADVATKRDLDSLRETTRRDIELVGQTLRGDFHEAMRVHLMVVLGFNLSMVAAVAALLR